MKIQKKSFRLLYEKVIAQIKHHYNNNHLIAIITEYAFGKYNPIVIDPNIPFLYNHKVVDSWYIQDQIKHINNDKLDIQQLELDMIGTKNNYKYFYHATSYNFATKIIGKKVQIIVKEENVWTLGWNLLFMLLHH